MFEEKEPRHAVIYSAEPPTPQQEEKFLRFLRGKYGPEITLSWEKSEKYPKGFRMAVYTEFYDWSVDGRLRQLKNRLENLSGGGGVIPLLRDAVQNWTPEVLAEEEGTVATVGDGIALVSGLDHVQYGEILLFPTPSGEVRGMAQDLREDGTGCILFDEDSEVCQGSTVRRTGKTAGVPVGDALVGRVVSALGAPLDGKGEIPAQSFRPIENPAPGIMDRRSVNRPLETGILAIDSMFPIGRGQRELIIGDRQTGKTAIALDTILNQKGKDVICIYVSIGQKAGSVAQRVRNLQDRGAWNTPSWSTPPPATRPPSSISPPTLAAPWGSSSWSRAETCSSSTTTSVSTPSPTAP